MGRIVSALVAGLGVSSGVAGAASSTGTQLSLGEQLFTGSLRYANQSLHGDFIRKMVDGTLPWAAFQYYLHQDNLYLTKYARAFAILGAKAERSDEMEWLLNESVGFLHEHGKSYNRDADEQTFEREASPTTVAYTSFFMQTAWQEDTILGYASVLPCQRLYDWLFAEVLRTMHVADGNPYKPYIEQYADPSNHRVSEKMEGFLQRYAAGGLREEVLARAQYHYDTAMQYEAEFFQQALDHCREAGCDPAPGPPPAAAVALTAVGGQVVVADRRLLGSAAAGLVALQGGRHAQTQHSRRMKAPVAAAAPAAASGDLPTGAAAVAAAVMLLVLAAPLAGFALVHGGGAAAAGRPEPLLGASCAAQARDDEAAEAPFVRHSP